MSRFQTKKALGQHFLIDNTVINNIIANIPDINNSNILEIGPGEGALTQHLIKHAKNVLALEKDYRLKTRLEIYKANNTNFDYIIADALTFNPLPYISENTYLVSNLPYNVGTQIFLNYLFLAKENPKIFQGFILMFQKEVALRIVANNTNNNYGRLSIISNLLSQTEYLFDVSKNSFKPPPEVESAVIKVTPLKETTYQVDIQNIEKITKLAFNGRRKTIRNTLKSLNFDFEKLGINPTKRPQELSLEEFCILANSL